VILSHELVVDSFAGGGGASTGIEAALGRPIDIAINHSPAAIAVHKANHPHTHHCLQDVWEVDPLEVTGGQPVGLAWFSPDCTHFSRAKGDKPRSKKVRSLAWVVTRWAKAVRPRIICLENVEEFATWGPLKEDGRPDPRRLGRTFRAWLAKLRSYGYRVEWRSLVAADYGAPTTRRRLFLVARCDGQPIEWPTPTHGRGRAHPWRSAAECIDWSLPCPSIFERRKPLADATMRRIAAGVRRYVLDAAQPFLVKYHGGPAFRGQGVDEPLRTVDTENRFALVSPFLAPVTHPQDARVHDVRDPMRTITAANRGEFALVAPVLASHYGNSVGRAATAPCPTVTAGGGGHTALVAAFLSKHNTGLVGQQTELPLGTVTVREHFSLGAAFLTKFYGTSVGSDVRAPMPTVTGRGEHLAAVRAFLVKYYGADGRDSQQSLFDPLHTVTTHDRFGLVTIAGEDYQIADIGMRMLAPHELFAAQGFPRDYVIAPTHHGRPLTRTAQIELAGNSVCPPLAEAIVRANTRRAESEAA